MDKLEAYEIVIADLTMKKHELDFLIEAVKFYIKYKDEVHFFEAGKKVCSEFVKSTEQNKGV